MVGCTSIKNEKNGELDFFFFFCLRTRLLYTLEHYWIYSTFIPLFYALQCTHVYVCVVMVTRNRFVVPLNLRQFQNSTFRIFRSSILFVPTPPSGMLRQVGSTCFAYS